MLSCLLGTHESLSKLFIFWINRNSRIYFKLTKGTVFVISSVPLFQGVTAIKKRSQNWKFPKYLGIWEIPQMPASFGNSPNTWEYGKFSKFLKDSKCVLFLNYRKFLKCLFIWEIPLMPGNLGNSPNSLGNLRVVYFLIIGNLSNA